MTHEQTMPAALQRFICRLCDDTSARRREFHARARYRAVPDRHAIAGLGEIAAICAPMVPAPIQAIFVSVEILEFIVR